MSSTLILTSCPINTSQLGFKCFILLWATSPSPMHSMISYWPEKLGCHGNLTLHPEFHCLTICTSCTTNDRCTVIHPHLHKLLDKWKHLWCWCLGAARPNARVYLHVHSHHLGVVITKVRRSITMLNNAMGVTDDRSMKVGHYVATLAVVAW